jgi:hypothetical protein
VASRLMCLCHSQAITSRVLLKERVFEERVVTVRGSVLAGQGEDVSVMLGGEAPTGCAVAIVSDQCQVMMGSAAVDRDA